MRKLNRSNHKVIPFLFKKEIKRVFGKNLDPFKVEETVILNNWHDKDRQTIIDLVFLILSHHLSNVTEVDHLHNMIYNLEYTFPTEEKENE